MYGTRPWCLVQAITQHTCPDPNLGSWNCLPHQAHIAPSEPMSSIDQQGSSLGSFPTFPSPLSPLLSAFGLLTMCQVVSGGRQWQINRERSSALPYTLELWLVKRKFLGHPRLRSPTLLTLLRGYKRNLKNTVETIMLL